MCMVSLKIVDWNFGSQDLFFIYYPCTMLPDRSFVFGLLLEGITASPDTFVVLLHYSFCDPSTVNKKRIVWDEVSIVLLYVFNTNIKKLRYSQIF